MSQTMESFSTFVRPPGSPVYPPSGPVLMLPKRAHGARARRDARSLEEVWTAPVMDARRQLSQLLALIQQSMLPVEPQRNHAIDAQAEEMSRSFQQLEIRLAERERALDEREHRLAERQRDLAEAEVLLQAREALLAASRKAPRSPVAISAEERAALDALRAELDRQESQLKENREALRERERFLAESEERLLAKVQAQQEKETELEQREEELQTRQDMRRPADIPPRAFDEFNE